MGFLDLKSGAWGTSGGRAIGAPANAIASAAGANGYASTNTLIMRFSSTSDDADMVWTDSETLGTFCTISRAGVYSFSGSLSKSAGGFDTVAINAAAALSNTFTGAHIKAPSLISGAGDVRALSGGARLAKGDVVWVSAAASAAVSASTVLSRVQITRIS